MRLRTTVPRAQSASARAPNVDDDAAHPRRRSADAGVVHLGPRGKHAVDEYPPTLLGSVPLDPDDVMPLFHRSSSPAKAVDGKPPRRNGQLHRPDVSSSANRRQPAPSTSTSAAGASHRQSTNPAAFSNSRNARSGWRVSAANTHSNVLAGQTMGDRARVRVPRHHRAMNARATLALFRRRRSIAR